MEAMHGCVFYTSMIYDMRFSTLGKYPMHWVLAHGRTGQTKRTEDGRGGEAGGRLLVDEARGTADACTSIARLRDIQSTTLILVCVVSSLWGYAELDQGE